MDMSPFVSSDPAVRADGWSPERKLRFLHRLASRGNVSAACAAVGMSRDAAYVLRRRDALFARGWNAALLLARESQAEILADKATEGIEEDVWYRGERVGTRRRFDARLLLAHIARLDKMAEEADDEAAGDAGRFDEILAAIAGADVPEELRDEHDAVAVMRECAVEDAGDAAGEGVDEAWAERVAKADAGEAEAGSEAGSPSDDDYAEYERERAAAVAAARDEAGARWDAWFREACGTVDAMLTQPAPAGEDAESSTRTVSDVSVSTAHATFVGPNGNRYARA